MPVIDQIAEASEKFFDTVEENNAKAKKATVAFVNRVQDNELPFADRMPTVPFADRMPTMPFAERIPAADKAVANGFDLVATGIEANRTFVGRVMERLGAEAPAPVTPAAAPKTTAKKATAKKSTAKKSTAKKAPAKKTTAKKTTARKATAKKTAAKK